MGEQLRSVERVEAAVGVGLFAGVVEAAPAVGALAVCKGLEHLRDTLSNLGKE